VPPTLHLKYKDLPFENQKMEARKSFRGVSDNTLTNLSEQLVLPLLRGNSPLL
jgi:hypothetical protein